MAKCIFQSSSGDSNKSILSSVTATSKDVLKGKVIVDSNGKPITGTIESMGGQTIAPSSGTKTITCNNKYMTGNITVKGDANLVAGNILSGKTIFGIAGNARRFVSKACSTRSSTSRKNFNSKSGTYNLYPVNVALGFHPVVFEYAYYKIYPGSCGMTQNDGTFLAFIDNNRPSLNFYIDGNIVSGTNLSMPSGSSNKFSDICAAGYN